MVYNGSMRKTDSFIMRITISEREKLERARDLMGLTHISETILTLIDRYIEENDLREQRALRDAQTQQS